MEGILSEAFAYTPPDAAAAQTLHALYHELCAIFGRGVGEYTGHAEFPVSAAALAGRVGTILGKTWTPR